jgi:hypothetical protein
MNLPVTCEQIELMVQRASELCTSDYLFLTDPTGGENTTAEVIISGIAYMEPKPIAGSRDPISGTKQRRHNARCRPHEIRIRFQS